MLGLLVLGLIAVVVAIPLLARQGSAMWGAAAKRRRERIVASSDLRYDPGRERRAEQRARELLRSCVNDEEWAMYRDLGFLRVYGGTDTGGTDTRDERRARDARDGGEAYDGSEKRGGNETRGGTDARVGADERRGARTRGSRGGDRRFPAGRDPRGAAPYAYLVYAHKPIVAFVPATGQFLSEYCVEFPDIHNDGRTRLPASDDVLAKWMALTSDESRVIGTANMHLVGRQHDPSRLRRDLWRLSEWDRRRGAEDDSVRARG